MDNPAFSAMSFILAAKSAPPIENISFQYRVFKKLVNIFIKLIGLGCSLRVGKELVRYMY